jgi:hypothetical protein
VGTPPARRAAGSRGYGAGADRPDTPAGGPGRAAGRRASVTNDVPDWSSTVYQLDTNLAGSPVAYVSGTVAATFTVPTGVHLLSITLPDNGNVTGLQVTGGSTSARYLSINPQLASTTTTYYVFVPYLVDPTVIVSITATGAGSAYVNGVSAPIAVAELAQNPAPWQAPTYPANPIDFDNPGAGASAVILDAPGAGFQLYLHAMWWMWSAASTTMTGHFGDSGGLVIGWDAALTLGTPRYMDHGGAKLNDNAAFQFTQVGAAAAGATHCYGSIAYSVY